MLKKLMTLMVISSTYLLDYSSASDECDLISSKYFQWLSSNGSLAKSSNFTVYDEDVYHTCGEWETIADNNNNNCLFCRERDVLICNGSVSSRIPSLKYLPTSHLSLFEISQMSSLPKDIFTGLSIKKLMIQNSNLSNLAADTFRGVASIQYLHLKYNFIGQLSAADSLFENIQDLRVMELKRNELKVLSSMSSANLPNLEYFSLSGNPLYDLNLFFLQNSALQTLNLRQVKFRVKNVNMKNSGFSFLPNTLNALDLSESEITVKNIDTMLELLSNKNITTLNLGNLVISMNINPFMVLGHISNTLQYLSLQGTRIKRQLTLDSHERKTIMSTIFYRLEEINMKNCGIEELGDGELFQAFPNLKVISLSGNCFVQLNLKMFSNFHTLKYLDLSSNKILQVADESKSISESLQVIDLSNSIIDLEEIELSRLLNKTPNIQVMSLCNAGITSANIIALQHMKSLNILDLSGTVSISQDLYSAFTDLFTSNISLTELYFSRNSFDTESLYFSMFSTLPTLKALNLSNNMIRSLRTGMFGSQLETLILSHNYITTWYSSITSRAKHLTFLDLQDNQLSYINQPMFSDFFNVSYLNLDNNPLMCHSTVVEIVCSTLTQEYTTNCTEGCWHQNQCYDTLENSYRNFNHQNDCSQYFHEVASTMENHTPSTKVHKKPMIPRDSKPNLIWVYVVVGAIVCTSVIGSTVYVRWWNIRCFIHRYLSLRRARKLKKDGEALARADVQYDVFVSYSDIDRSWVLDYLIPSLEADGDISLCFHERDFQVGLSILENIIECMDRSNAILLIVSSAFVRSKWCQFEMHLAQYRLIETYRDQLVLVLLEDIPRKTRPQTLHHLMMTKTYIVWPLEPYKEETRDLFWKRLKRALKPTYNLFDA